MTNIVKVPAEKMKSALGGIILDVRTALEHQTVALKAAHKHVPLDMLDPIAFAKEHAITAQKPLYILCRSGMRAAKAAAAFAAAGVNNVHVIDGGIMACESCGVPVKKGDVMSLERQVRITVGVFVLTGVALGTYMHPGFYLLSAAMGAGLIFAGVTDRCGMAMILAKMPWNPKTAEAVTTCSVQVAPQAVPVPAFSEGNCANSGPAVAAPVAQEGVTFYAPANGTPVLQKPKQACGTSGAAGGCS